MNTSIIPRIRQYLPILEFAYNSFKHSSTGYSPIILIYGFWPCALIDAKFHRDELHSTQNLLMDMEEISRFYIDFHQQPCVFLL